jgi:arylsulfatase A-like enzyme
MINMVENEYDIYDRQTYRHDRVTWDGEEQHPQVATPGNVTPPPYYPEHPIVREEWSRYLNSVSGMDIRVGWILEQLEKDGVADNTIVVFFGDNGRMEPRGIHWLWDSGIHVPMIIYYPESVPAPAQHKVGGVNEQVISLIDLTATTLEMAGITKPLGMQGRRFLGREIDPPRRFAFSARDRIDETALRMRSVRGDRYHYIRNYSEGEGFFTLNRYKEKCFRIKPVMRTLMAEGKLKGAALQLMQPMPYELLYDTLKDPHEIVNLAQSKNPAHRAALVAMSAALDTWMAETGDRGVFPEPKEVVAPFTKEMHDWFGTPDWVLEKPAK